MSLLPSLALAAALSAPPEPAELIGYRALRLDGAVQRLGLDAELALHPVALVFLDTGCPISNRYAPELVEFAALAAEHEVEFYGVLSSPDLVASAARTWAEEYGVELPLLVDSAGELARRLEPEHVPEAFVISAQDELVYRGRIDNRYASVGRVRATISSHDLRDAIEAVALGEPIEPARTDAVGCIFESWGDQEPSEVTYERHIAPLLASACTTCHRAGGVGPFDLTSYESARRRARMSAYVIEERLMPPWHAKRGYGHFRGERALSASEIALFQRWAEAGAPRGEEEDVVVPAAPVEGEWALGEPDLVLEMLEPFEVPARGEDIYQYFVIPFDLVEERDLVALEFRPGDPSVVHHSILYVDETGWAREEDAKHAGPGFPTFGTSAEGLDSLLFSGDALSIGGWAPGSDPYQLPEGLGIPLPARGDLIMEVHYHLSGKPASDQSSLGLYFADEPVERDILGLVIGTEEIEIPAGESTYQRHVWMDVPAPMDVIDLSPHMHYLGRDAQVVATLPDGTREWLLYVPDWDFRWQSVYVYREPFHLPAGSRIDCWISFDNSADNPDNPSSPPVVVGEGRETTDEMCLLFFNAVALDPADEERLSMASFASFFRDPGAGPPPPGPQPRLAQAARSAGTTAFDLQTFDPFSEAGLAAIEALPAEEFSALLERASERVRQSDADADAHTLHASLLVLGLERPELVDRAELFAMQAWSGFEQALHLDDAHWNARLGQAVLGVYSEYEPWERVGRSRLDELIAELEASAEPPPAERVTPYLLLADFHWERGEEEEAATILQRGLDRFPEHPELLELWESGD